MVTSRPEGVNLPRFVSQFVVFRLKPLSDEQQRSAVTAQVRSCGLEPGSSCWPALIDLAFVSRVAQLRGNEFADHLVAFASIRRRHDVVYSELFSEKERSQVEALTAPDLFCLPSAAGTVRYDPSMRQCSLVVVIVCVDMCIDATSLRAKLKCEAF